MYLLFTLREVKNEIGDLVRTLHSVGFFKFFKLFRSFHDNLLIMRPSCKVRHSFFIHTSDIFCGNIFSIK